MQAYTIRPTILKHKANASGITSIRICVTVNRKQTYVATEHRIHTDQWDEERAQVTGHENAALINISLRRKIAEMERTFINNNLEGVPVTKRLIHGFSGMDRSFVQFAREIRPVEKEITRVTNFAGLDLMLSEINVTFLRRYEHHERKRGMANNTMNTTFKYLRRIMTQAKAEKLIKENPFDEFEMVRYQQTDRVYLTMEELQLIIDKVDDFTGSMRTTVYYFLLGAFSGLRHSDWGRFNYATMVEHGYMKIRTKKNKKHVVLPIGKTLNKILKVAKTLPPPMSNQKCNVMLKAIAVSVGLKKELTTHVARHSFGYMCASNRIPKSVTAELMGVHISTVEVYYHLSGQNIIDQAAILTTL